MSLKHLLKTLVAPVTTKQSNDSLKKFFTQVTGSLADLYKQNHSCTKNSVFTGILNSSALMPAKLRTSVANKLNQTITNIYNYNNYHKQDQQAINNSKNSTSSLFRK